jgi:hypothetical protein
LRLGGENEPGVSKCQEVPFSRTRSAQPSRGLRSEYRQRLADSGKGPVRMGPEGAVAEAAVGSHQHPCGVYTIYTTCCAHGTLEASGCRDFDYVTSFTKFQILAEIYHIQWGSFSQPKPGHLYTSRYL